MGKPSKWAETLMHLTCFLNLSCSDLDKRGCCHDWTILCSVSVHSGNFHKRLTHQMVSFVHKFTGIITDIIIVAFE